MNIAALERELLAIWKTWKIRVNRGESAIGADIYLELVPPEDDPIGEDDECCVVLKESVSLEAGSFNQPALNHLILAHLCGAECEIFDEFDRVIARDFSITGVSIKSDGDSPQKVSEILMEEIVVKLNDAGNEFELSLEWSSLSDLGDLPKPFLRRLQQAAAEPV